MKFGPVPVADAAGAVLAHSMEAAKTPYGTSKSYRLAKGTLLNAQHLSDLAQHGHTHVTVARLEHGDVEENQAAQQLANALVCAPDQQGIRIAQPGAGRVNLYAQHAGVAVVESARINALNAIDPMITIATVPPFHRVDAGGMIATIKIISYSVPRDALDRAMENASHAIRIAPPAFRSATLIETQTGTDAPSQKGRDALRGRLDRFDVALSERVIVPHKTEAIANALRDAPGEFVFILTASATSDTHDVGPQALRNAGGYVEAFGMPVDPGNLLFFGTLADKPVIGLPGCARSPALNGADWVMERLICAVPLTQADIASMGVGGLLKEIPTRPQPRRSGE